MSAGLWQARRAQPTGRTTSPAVTIASPVPKLPAPAPTSIILLSGSWKNICCTSIPSSTTCCRTKGMPHARSCASTPSRLSACAAMIAKGTRSDAHDSQVCRGTSLGAATRVPAGELIGRELERRCCRPPTAQRTRQPLDLWAALARIGCRSTHLEAQVVALWVDLAGAGHGLALD